MELIFQALNLQQFLQIYIGILIKNISSSKKTEKKPVTESPAASAVPEPPKPIEEPSTLPAKEIIKPK